MDGADKVFKGKNLYTVPIHPPSSKSTVLHEPFTLFEKDPFILWRKADESGDANRTVQTSPVARSEA